jgi:hypothetical protein
MKKVIKLKESDLMNIIKRVIKEQSETGLESKLRGYGYNDASNTGGKTVLVKKTQGSGNFFFEFKNDGAILNVLKPNNSVIQQFKLKQICKQGNCEWYTKGFQSNVECERLADVIESFVKSISSSPVNEDRLDFENMSDDELHSLHPEVKKHPKHFKDYRPTSEYLGWKGEVSKRNMYKRNGKFHNAFDKKKED